MCRTVGDTDKPLSAHIEQARKTYEKLGIEFEVTDDSDPGIPPPGFDYIWTVFLDLSAARQVGFGPCPIAYRDILAWSQLTGVKLKTWEVEFISRLDSLWLKVISEQLKKPKGAKGE
jgi:hypothetical protein